MKQLIVTIFLLISLSNSQAANKMLAVVNDSYVIFDYDLEKRMIFLKLTNPEVVKNTVNLKNLVLNQMINSHLIAEDAKKYQVRVTAREILRTIAQIEKNNKLKKDALLQKAQKYGLSREDFIATLTEELTVDRMKQTMSFAKAKASQLEIATEMNRVLNLNGKVEFLLYEISVSTANKSKEEAKKKIDLIYESLVKGAGFQILARRFSEDISAKNQGQIGWTPEVFLSSNALAALSQIKPGTFSKPFFLVNKYKILYLKQIRPLLYLDINNPQHLEQLKKFARQKIIYDKAQIYLEDYIKETYQNAQITLY